MAGKHGSCNYGDEWEGLKPCLKYMEEFEEVSIEFDT